MSGNKRFAVTVIETRVYHKTVTVEAANKAEAKAKAMQRRRVMAESQLLIGKTRITQRAAKIN